MTSVTSQLAKLERKHFLQAISELQAGVETSFNDSIKYDVLYMGKRYAPKELAGIALQNLTNRQFGPSDFKGGAKSACFNALRRCGLIIVSKKAAAHHGSFVDALGEVLLLQKQYTYENTASMQRRGQLIRHVIPDFVRDHTEEIEPVFSKLGYQFSVQGSDGKGPKNESPWVRIFDPNMSPSATHGWYVVLHFSRDGEVLYSTLGCGATVWKDGALVPVPDHALADNINWARKTTNHHYPNAVYFSESIDLKGNKLSRQFEKATAFAKSYRQDGFKEETFWSDLITLCTFLVTLYEQDRLGRTPLSLPPEIVEAEAIVNAVSRPARRGSKGQGFGLTYDERMAVERQAMAVARQGLTDKGFKDIKDVSLTESYDYSALLDEIRWKVEVKGTTSDAGDCFLLTGPELRLHKANVGRTILAVVSDILLDRTSTSPTATGGHLEMHIPWNPEEWDFEPTGYRVTRRQS